MELWMPPKGGRIMKIYKQIPEYIIRVQITQQGSPAEYLSLSETTPKEVIELIKKIVLTRNDPFAKKRTSVNIREAQGGANGKSKSVSFHGLTPKELHDLMIKEINQ
jgi:hypothetical protein